MRASSTGSLSLSLPFHHVLHHRDSETKKKKVFRSRSATTNDAPYSDGNFCIGHEFYWTSVKARNADAAENIFEKNKIQLIHMPWEGLWLSFHIWIGHFLHHPYIIHASSFRTYTRITLAGIYIYRVEHDKRDSRWLSNVQLTKNYTFVSDVAVVAITFRETWITKNV